MCILCDARVGKYMKNIIMECSRYTEDRRSMRSGVESLTGLKVDKIGNKNQRKTLYQFGKKKVG